MLGDHTLQLSLTLMRLQVKCYFPFLYDWRCGVTSSNPVHASCRQKQQLSDADAAALHLVCDYFSV